jgi:hypothetical protein
MPQPQEFQNVLGTAALTIGSAGSFSGSVYLNGAALYALATPGTFTAAPITFQVTYDATPPNAGGTWLNLYSGTVEYSVGTLYGTAVQYLPPADVSGVQWLRLRSGNAAGGTLQAADRTFVLITRPI